MSDDWDDDTTTTSNGFGGGFGRGMRAKGGDSGGFGFGRARGKTMNGDINMNGDDKPSGGFGANRGSGDSGGGNRGGFGSNRQSNDDNEGGGGGFGGNRSGGFGSNRSGGGGGGGFGGNRKNDDDEDATRGGGFGGGRSGGGRGAGGGGNACFKCGESGHFSRECPNAESGGGGGGGNSCYKCGESGHFARECPNSEGGGGGGRGGGGGGNCFKCGESGHFSRECPNAESGGGGGGGKGGCYKCGEDGHIARECPSAAGASVDADGKPREIYVPPPPPESEEEIFASMQKGINFDKYNEIPVECTGNKKPDRPIQSFDEGGFTETIMSNIQKARYEKPTPIQKWAIPTVNKGSDLMGCAQTGSGKTAAFLLPILSCLIRDGVEGGGSFAENQTPHVIIVGPTRELVTQIFHEARKFSHGSIIRACVAYGGTSVGHQLRDLEKGCHLLVATPGRLMDFINRGKVNLSKVRFLVLDEADRMLDMGFIPEIRKLAENPDMPSKTDRHTLMFSATFPAEIQKLASEFLEDYTFITVGRVGAANTDIEQNVFEVANFSKRDKLVEILNESGTDRVLVFTEQKRQADFIASFLSQSKFPSTSIHGDRLQREREEALRDFKTGKAPIMVATSVAARGLDIPNVMHVVNYDLPDNIDEYVHRIGRTGRCGNLGKATSFFDPERDGGLARSLVKVLQDAQQEMPPWLEEAAEKNVGTGFSGAGGAYGSRDTRKGKFGGGDSDDFGGGGGGGGGFGGGAAAADDDDWD